MAMGPHGVRGEAHRPVVTGLHGMVCSGHPLASVAGVSVLQRGGNAVDAAIATAAALNVVEPNMSGLGGDGFIMMYDRAARQVRVMNATGPAPRRATREAYQDTGIPMKGARSVSVPGLLSGWCQVHRFFGRQSLRDDFAMAIDLAERGFPISRKLSLSIAADPALVQFPSSRVIFSRDGVPLPEGALLIQRDLAQTFRDVAETGETSFYRGRIAKAILRALDEDNGLFVDDDLAGYRARWQDPISVDYHGHTIFQAPPNSSGHVLLQMLNLVETFDLTGRGANDAAGIHLLVEAKRLAFADREAYLADPDFVDVPIDGLLSKEYAAVRRRLIDPTRAATEVWPGDPRRCEAVSRAHAVNARAPSQSDTTCFVVADAEGNVVCQLQSIQTSFGSGLVAEGTGLLLNNRMTYWHLDPEHVDCLVPGKRVRHTMNPFMVFRNGELLLAGGTPGADTQVQTNAQMITNVLDHGFNVVEAVEAPRWRHLQNPTESTVPHTCVDELLLESRFSAASQEGLRERAQPVRVIGDWEATGSAMLIGHDPETGALLGAADPRRDGYAIGW